ncbi:very short patch repair endonuclease [Litchfieldella qijiaojingensis]|uniref:Very short patch repair endonuclease n=1 Tax=Litchfieldella qijiaojingensis TaxID=980347 RepID=A0ABQ2ZG24_9GAMM|nr:DNA mismatch endonuclease Vsr [Halomonas qijiaojingensis]GGY11739.1 very short patch repair endonuclease [Halomonas qijiaojingensis]
MADTLSPSERSERMSRVRAKNTKPEMKLRSLVHGMGFRYRLHAKHLPGTPDMVFPSRRAVIFMHGCFWHRHEGCRLARLPKSRVSFWERKLEANRLRDRRNQIRLQELGWRVLVVWECQLVDLEDTARWIRDFLNNKTGTDHDEIG